MRDALDQIWVKNGDGREIWVVLGLSWNESGFGHGMRVSSWRVSKCFVKFFFFLIKIIQKNVFGLPEIVLLGPLGLGILKISRAGRSNAGRRQRPLNKLIIKLIRVSQQNITKRLSQFVFFFIIKKMSLDYLELCYWAHQALVSLKKQQG